MRGLFRVSCMRFRKTRNELQPKFANSGACESITSSLSGFGTPLPGLDSNIRSIERVSKTRWWWLWCAQFSQSNFIAMPTPGWLSQEKRADSKSELFVERTSNTEKRSASAKRTRLYGSWRPHENYCSPEKEFAMHIDRNEPQICQQSILVVDEMKIHWLQSVVVGVCCHHRQLDCRVPVFTQGHHHSQCNLGMYETNHNLLNFIDISLQPSRIHFYRKCPPLAVFLHMHRPLGKEAYNIACIHTSRRRTHTCQHKISKRLTFDGECDVARVCGGRWSLGSNQISARYQRSKM